MVQQLLTNVAQEGRIIRDPFGITTIALNTHIAQQLDLKKFSGWYVQRVATGSIAAE